MKRILVLCPWPAGTAASQRFRFEQYLDKLAEQGYQVDQQSFWDDATWEVLHKSGHYPRKIPGLLKGFLRRLEAAAKCWRYDYVFIHLEAAPIGPPIIEAVLMLLRRRLIYDIDDAIFLAKTSSVHSIASKLRWRSKIAWTTKHSYKVSVVNEFVHDWAKQYNTEVQVVPTTIDPRYHAPTGKKTPNPVPIIGWTGTQSTAPYLDLVRPALRELQKEHKFALRVICNVDPGFDNIEDYRFIEWTEHTEIEDLETFDIGLMPVPDTTWSKGKVGFKAIQYSALEIPPVASDVGSGKDVVIDGETGFLVPNDPEAWRSALSRMLNDTALRQAMGKRAREFILRRYSVPAQAPTFLGLFS